MELRAQQNTAISVGVPISVVLDWVKGQTIAPLPAAWVPGATADERSELAALGGAVSAAWNSEASEPQWVRDIPEIHSWLTGTAAAPSAVGAAMRDVAKEGPASLARLYDAVVAPASRRNLGTFFTPPPEARWMIDRWTALFGEPDSAVDVGAGVGVFTAGALGAWPSAQVLPVDVNPVTLGLVGLLTSRQDVSRLQPVLDDFGRWSLRGFSALPGRRLLLGNPPYTRLQLIPHEQRDTLREAAGGLCGARSSLSALILGAALTALAEGDGVCFLLPAQWLESDYAQGIRQWLWSRQSRRVELHLFESRLFMDAQVDAVALIVGREEESEQPLILGMARSADGEVTSGTRTVQRAARAPANWRKLLHAEVDGPAVCGRRLSEYATIRRGVATGANSYFTLSKEEVARWSLPDRVLRPFVQRTRDHGGSAVSLENLAMLPPTAKSRILIVGSMGPHDALVTKYIEHGESGGLDRRHLAQARRVWFSLETEAAVPDLIVSASARQGFAVLENKAGAVIANNLYGLRWHARTSQKERAAVTRWLRSKDGQDALLAGSRRHAEGLRKLEIRDLASLVVPDHAAAD